jgi:hypothetical protein
MRITLKKALRIANATAICFMYTAIFYKCKSLIPCTVSHTVINITSAFTVELEGETVTISASAIVLIFISVGYAIILLMPKGIVQKL